MRGIKRNNSTKHVRFVKSEIVNFLLLTQGCMCVHCKELNGIFPDSHEKLGLKGISGHFCTKVAGGINAGGEGRGINAGGGD